MRNILKANPWQNHDYNAFGVFRLGFMTFGFKNSNFSATRDPFVMLSSQLSHCSLLLFPSPSPLSSLSSSSFCLFLFLPLLPHHSPIPQPLIYPPSPSPFTILPPTFFSPPAASPSLLPFLSLQTRNGDKAKKKLRTPRCKCKSQNALIRNKIRYSREC